ncbi:MAG: TonB-dependent receptor, partial [Pseudomonadota bacterium]
MSFCHVIQGLTCVLSRLPRRRLAQCAGILAAVIGQMPAQAQTSGSVFDFQIPPQNAIAALEQFSDQTGLSFAYSTEALLGIGSPGVRGSMPSAAALDSLFTGTGLSYEFTGENTISVAQAAQVDDLTTDADAVSLSPIIVSARRTEEILSDVPGSVAVLTNQELERSNITSVDEAFLRLPNVNFRDNSKPTDVFFTIRGIGELAGGTTSGPTNGVFVDGVLVNPTGSQIGINTSLVDLERIETAFGPQGTAFGRSTIGGAINLVTKKPTDEFSAEFIGDVGSYPNGNGTLIVNAPLLEDGLLSARLIAFGGTSDGYVDFANISDPDSNTQTDAGFRFSMRSRPTDRLTLDGSVSFDRSVFDGDNSASLESFNSGNPASDVDFIGDNELDRLFGTAQAAYDFDYGTLIATTSYRQTESDFALDLDSSALDLTTLRGQNTERSFTQEFRFESDDFELDDGLGSFRVNAGAIMSYSEFDLFNIREFGDDTLAPFLAAAPPAFIGNALGLPPEALPPGGAPFTTATFPAGALGDNRNPGTREIFHLGLYGDVRWRPVDPLELTVGARFHRDRISLTSEVTSSGLTELFFPSIPAFGDEAIFTAVTPNALTEFVALTNPYAAGFDGV